MYKITTYIIFLFQFSSLIFGQKVDNISIDVYYETPYGVSVNGKEIKKIFHPNRGNWDHQLNLPFFTKLFQTNANHVTSHPACPRSHMLIHACVPLP